MNTKLLSFDQFTKGPKLDLPKTAMDVDPAKKLTKEPFVNQVKKANLSTDIEATEPDYSKTQKEAIQEDLAVDDAKLKADAQKQIDLIDQQLAALEKSSPNKTDSTYVTKRSSLNDQKKVIIDKLKADQQALAKAATV
jgi:MinD-like ATPase involved in chromosome partitioning or flagellar assembly